MKDSKSVPYGRRTCTAEIAVSSTTYCNKYLLGNCFLKTFDRHHIHPEHVHPRRLPILHYYEESLTSEGQVTCLRRMGGGESSR
jgi:hypothetical protein